LTVGGQNVYQLNQLSKQGDGWINDTVQMKMRIVAEIVP